MIRAIDDSIHSAANAIREANALLITAGAGMGVDSCLPDFRGSEGFWKAYPPYRALGLRFEQLANPAHFDSDPHLAWGFYGHRLHLYRETKPHTGFDILKIWSDLKFDWAQVKIGEHFVFTSNVDGQFAAAGFKGGNIVECHGSIHHLQCAKPCCNKIWPATGIDVCVDPLTMRAKDPLPTCPNCGGIARPNILMFGDDRWLPNRTEQTSREYRSWSRYVANNNRKLAVIECGAGTAIPIVRLESERVARANGGTLIRINVREPQVPDRQISIPLPAAEALDRIASAMKLPF